MFRIETNQSNFRRDSHMVILNPIPNHLSYFSFDREKIEYFNKASKLVEKLNKSNKNRKKAQKEREDVAAETERLRKQVQENKKKMDLELEQIRLDNYLEKEKARNQRSIMRQ